MKYPKPFKYNVINKHKYIGDVNNVVGRSMLEKKYMLQLDTNPQIKFWNSEEISIPYYITIQRPDGKYELLDNKPHRYFLDFYVETIQGNKFLVEVKPYSQTHKPRNSAKKNSKTLLNEHLVFAKNDSKWRAAKRYAEENHMSFIILTERDIK